MRNFLFFLFFLPLLVALGHDLYLLYETPEKGFVFSKLGYSWTHYHPESYKQAVEATDPYIWPYINFILTQYAVLVALIFGGGLSALTLIFSGFGGGKPSKDTGRASTANKRVDDILNKGKTSDSKINYKRK